MTWRQSEAAAAPRGLHCYDEAVTLKVQRGSFSRYHHSLDRLLGDGTT
jgi:hypothetical protein